ncbi:Methyl-accepting chemotaxis sensor/transducer protein [hydrothermal vent metagenome]|uniref:Methyl-accepting chemotaxis sensor/transducer protein n=1 Tax=hydrothermal vent metagenome TaxID=652676 RepID=A0A3B0XHF3_9ZZZZ
MNGFNAISIRYKILSIVIISVLGYAITLFDNYRVSSQNSIRLTNVSTIYYPTLEKVTSNIVMLDKVKEALNAASSSEELDFIEDADEIILNINKQFGEITALDNSVSNDITQLEKLLNNYYTVAKALTTNMVEGGLSADEASRKVKLMQEKLTLFNEAINTFRSVSYNNFTNSLEESKSSSDMAIKVGLTISLIVVVIVTLVGYYISNNIVSNISNVVNSLQNIAKGGGDLSQRINVNSKDEMGELVVSFNEFVEKLQGIIGHIMGSTEQLALSSTELGSVSETATQSSAQQQNEVNQVATAMNEMTATVQEVSRNAAHAAEAAQVASTQADEGLKVVDLTINSINNLASAVEQASTVINVLESDTGNIGVVLEVIRGISEQTNLLALNAAIEAARAGEQGRGFAVVADEVRTLASRTQQSTLEIQEIIEKLQTGSTEAVDVMQKGRDLADTSVSHVKQAGDSLKDITQAVISISDMNMQIATASEEQSSVTEEINQNIVNISQAGETTVENAQKTSTASESLSTISSELQGLVGQFKV